MKDEIGLWYGLYKIMEAKMKQEDCVKGLKVRTLSKSVGQAAYKSAAARQGYGWILPKGYNKCSEIHVAENESHKSGDYFLPSDLAPFDEINIGETKRVRIVDIYENDAWFSFKVDYIGQVGMFTRKHYATRSQPKDFIPGDMVFDNHVRGHTFWTFHSVKLEILEEGAMATITQPKGTTKYKELKPITPAAIYEAGDNSCNEFNLRFMQFLEWWKDEYGISFGSAISLGLLVERFPNHPSERTFLLEHGFIEQAKEEVTYSRGDRFKSNDSEWWLCAVAGGEKMDLICTDRGSLDYARTYSSEPTQVHDKDKITQDEFDRICSPGGFTKI